MTPASPAQASAHRNGRAVNTARAPSASAMSTSGAAADPAVEVDLGAALDRVDDLLQHVDARGDAVQLATAVVAHPHGVGPMLDGEARVLCR